MSTAMAVQNLCLAAHALGMDTCVMTAPRRSASHVFVRHSRMMPTRVSRLKMGLVERSQKTHPGGATPARGASRFGGIPAIDDHGRPYHVNVSA
jgi:hypothetical protein